MLWEIINTVLNMNKRLENGISLSTTIALIFSFNVRTMEKDGKDQLDRSCEK